MSTPEIGARQPIEVAVEAGKSYWWCACGRSKSQPFCDGSHKGTGFTPIEWKAQKSEPAWFCCCKQPTDVRRQPQQAVRTFPSP
jgi:CDGSH iron-sulfur domain-containing protein 3